MRFPRHMYKDMVLLSTVVLAHSLNVYRKMAVQQNLPDFNDNPRVDILHNIFFSKKPMIEVDRNLKIEN